MKKTVRRGPISQESPEIALEGLLRTELHAFALKAGLEVLGAMFESEREAVCGPGIGILRGAKPTGLVTRRGSWFWEAGGYASPGPGRAKWEGARLLCSPAGGRSRRKTRWASAHMSRWSWGWPPVDTGALWRPCPRGWRRAERARVQ